MTFNQEAVKAVFEANNTAGTIRDVLSDRKRFRPQTNLNKFRNDLLAKGHKIVADEFIATFQGLQQQGVGSLIIGRRGKPNRFLWNYNLKEVVKALDGSKPVTELKVIQEPTKVLTKRSKPFKKVEIASKQELAKAVENASQAKPTSTAVTPKELVVKGPISITFNLENVRAEDITALTQLVSGLQK